MPTHAEVKTLPYTPEQMFDLVADIDRYPEFLPWCLDANVWERNENEVLADLVIGYGPVREKFTSRVTLERPGHIHVEYLKGPMKHLSNHWRFIENGDGGTTIDFFLDFEFKSPLMQRVVGMLFQEAVRRMVAAFEARARALYGAPPSKAG